MAIKKRVNGEQVEISVEGRLTLESHREFYEVFSYLKSRPVPRAVLDITRIQSLDASGMRLIMCLEEACRKQRVDFTLKVPEEGSVGTLLSVAHFDELVNYA